MDFVRSSAPTPVDFFLHNLDLSHLAEQRRQEWDYAQHQHAMHLRRRREQEDRERADFERKMQAAVVAAELERRMQQQRMQAQHQAQLRYQQDQRLREQQRARRTRLAEQARPFQAQRAHAREQAERRVLLTMLESYPPEAVEYFYRTDYDTIRARAIKEQQREDAAHRRQQQQAIPSPVELLSHLFPQQRSENTHSELEHKHSQQEVITAASAAPEEVDLAIAAAVVAATEEEGQVASAESDGSTDLADDEVPTDETRQVALASLSGLAEDFTARRRTFVSPASLSFQAAPSTSPTASRSPTPPLAFESSNTSFLGYEDFLVSLLSRIDAVESHGIREVKLARKDLVKEVEQELARLDGLKEQAWERLSAASSSSSSSSSEEDEPLSASESSSEEDEDVEMSPEPVEVLTLDDSSASSADESDSASEVDDSTPVHVKIPFAVRPASPHSSRRSKVRFARHSPRNERNASPALSDSSTSSAFADILASEQVADILLQAHRLGEQVAQAEEAERDQQEMASLIESDSEDEAEDSGQEDEEMLVMYF
ncbi:hypothetical protein JCM10908_000526 [Rhodotorula pacifica]|uniref:BAG family molecular chaperone regulator n=1 Tax=Rhodotorula pacifica TaxID=1495444 RepID=UPI00316F3AD6